MSDVDATKTAEQATYERGFAAGWNAAIRDRATWTAPVCPVCNIERHYCTPCIRADCGMRARA